MKYSFLVIIIVSILSISTVIAQDTAVAVLGKATPAKQVSEVELRGYVFGPGDEISVKIPFEKEYDFTATIDANGNVEIPFSDKPLLAKCKTERELRTDIQTAFSKYLINPVVNLKLEKRARPPVTVYGEVRNAKQYDLVRQARLADLIAASGGLTEEAGGMIQVFRPEKPMCSFDIAENNWQPETGDPTEVPSRLYSLNAVRTGGEDANPVILPGDIIYVQKAAPVYVTGEVLSPQGVLLKETGTTVTEAISMVGGARREAKIKDVKIYRRKTGTKDRDVISANLELIKTGKAKDVLLEPYDIIEVDKSKKSIPMLILEIAIGASKSVISSAASQTGVRVVY